MPSNNSEQNYSTVTGLVYIFNLIIGTGALALPGALSKAGWLPGTFLICILALFSFITVTFIVETLAVANAVGRQRTLHVQYGEEEDHPLLGNNEDIFEIKEKFELSELAAGLLSKGERLVVGVCLVAYLFGDLSIYCAVISRTLVHTLCSSACNNTMTDIDLCWQSSSLTRINVYRIGICLVILLLGPLTFINLQKTKLLQMLTSCIRWISFTIMIVWSLKKLVTEGSPAPATVVNLRSIPTLFGTCVYAFMCQHSIPCLLQPIANKVKFVKTLSFDYALIALFYLLLSLTAIFTFSNVEGVYTLNFWNEACGDDTPMFELFMGYFLALFPVFTLSTSFPIIAITLRNNLSDIVGECYGAHLWLTAVTCIAPAVLASALPDLQLLVGIVGSYAGTALQYLAPTLLVTAARSRSPNVPENPYRSPFRSRAWIIAVHVWTVVSLVIISVNYLTELLNRD